MTNGYLFLVQYDDGDQAVVPAKLIKPRLAAQPDAVLPRNAPAAPAAGAVTPLQGSSGAEACPASLPQWSVGDRVVAMWPKNLSHLCRSWYPGTIRQFRGFDKKEGNLYLVLYDDGDEAVVPEKIIKPRLDAPQGAKPPTNAPPAPAKSVPEAPAAGANLDAGRAAVLAEALSLARVVLCCAWATGLKVGDRVWCPDNRGKRALPFQLTAMSRVGSDVTLGLTGPICQGEGDLREVIGTFRYNPKLRDYCIVPPFSFDGCIPFLSDALGDPTIDDARALAAVRYGGGGGVGEPLLARHPR